MLVCLFGHYSTQLVLLCAYWSSHSISSVCACWYFSELFISQIILIVCLSVRVCVCCCVCDAPISCFSTYRFLNAIPQCSHSIISRTTHTFVDLHLMHKHTQPCTHWRSAHSSALSQALCVKQVDLCLSLSLSLSVSVLCFLLHSFYICHHLSHTCALQNMWAHTQANTLYSQNCCLAIMV